MKATQQLLRTVFTAAVIGVITTAQAQVNTDDNSSMAFLSGSEEETISSPTGANSTIKANEKAGEIAQKESAMTASKEITFQVYPDQADAGKLTVFTNQSCATIEITDMNGNLVYCAGLENESAGNPAQYESNLQPGLYTISLRTENRVTSRQLVIK